MSWEARAAANILPLSKEQRLLGVALGEWRYTGNFHDLEQPSETCELCNHPDIRYQFEIRNLYTEHALLVGSECINRFGIAATDEEGRALDAAETRKKLGRDRRRLLEDARTRSVINALVGLSYADREFGIHSFIDYLQKRGAFTPKQLSTLFWRLEKHRIPHKPADFKLTIRRGRERDQLQEMTDWELKRLWPCLSPAQRAFLEQRGRSPTR